ncbi:MULTISPECIES: DUF4181 domain-containing protein [Paenibacillus]|jgi:protein-S-isoprenylcysteine O-methyltransferase Ste14|uniref:DUF4181 domain-containing protein n=1 Tax=Paenibacillus lautus TaxID=1401 RepID=A0A385U0L3_PAELA|nr:MULTISPECIES: DUF4181 domain-containing protein [Paenibacillus]AWP25306.1 hypothetical protein B9D94_01095 [Paenibacillus sp. Cedars]AYB48177.1 DUF4181 domain-containing protein [Paenibacillus lautus]
MKYIFTVVLFIAAVIQLVLDKTISKTDEKISDTDGVIPYRGFVVFGAIAIILSVIFIKEPPYNYVSIGVLLTLVFGVRAIFQWKYIRNSKKHIISLSMMALSVIGTTLYALTVVW